MNIPPETPKREIVAALPAVGAPLSCWTSSKTNDASMSHEKRQVVETMSSASAELFRCGSRKKPTPEPFYPPHIKPRASSQNQRPLVDVQDEVAASIRRRGHLRRLRRQRLSLNIDVDEEMIFNPSIAKNCALVLEETTKKEIVVALPAAGAPLSCWTGSKANDASMLHEKHPVVETMSSTSTKLLRCGSEKKPTLEPFYLPHIQHRASSQNQRPSVDVQDDVAASIRRRGHLRRLRRDRLSLNIDVDEEMIFSPSIAKNCALVLEGSKANDASMSHEKRQVVETMSSTSVELLRCGSEKNPTPEPFYPPHILHWASSQNQRPSVDVQDDVAASIRRRGHLRRLRRDRLSLNIDVDEEMIFSPSKAKNCALVLEDVERVEALKKEKAPTI